MFPQDTARLTRIDLLPMCLSSLPDYVRFIWTGKSLPTADKLHKIMSLSERIRYITRFNGSVAIMEIIDMCDSTKGDLIDGLLSLSSRFDAYIRRITIGLEEHGP